MTEERTDTLRLPKEVTRLVVLGDPHGDLVGLELVLEREAKPGVAIASAGDNVGYADGKVSSYMCQLLAERKIPSVYGNHEEWSRGGTLTVSPPGMSRELTPEALEWCRGLPYRIKIESERAPTVAIHIVHSFPDWEYVNADKARRLTDREEQAHVVFCGHTHRPAIYTLGPRAKRAKVQRLDPTKKTPVEVAYERGKRYVVDAGSLARPSKGRSLCESRGTYAAIELDTLTLSLHSVDKGPRLRALFEQWAAGPPGSS